MNVLPRITKKNTPGRQESFKLILSPVKHDHGTVISSTVRPTEFC
jgi:hypothetical protein